MVFRSNIYKLLLYWFVEYLHILILIIILMNHYQFISFSPFSIICLIHQHILHINKMVTNQNFYGYMELDFHLDNYKQCHSLPHKNLHCHNIIISLLFRNHMINKLHMLFFQDYLLNEVQFLHKLQDNKYSLLKVYQHLGLSLFKHWMKIPNLNV